MEPSKSIPYLFIGSSLLILILATTPTTASQQDVDFLNGHNKARVHAGLPPLSWDLNLFEYARTWANKQVGSCKSMVHSNGPYGENLWWGAVGHPWSPRHAIKGWLREHRFYDRRSNTCLAGKKCGHYTQMLWRDTTKLGCAQVQCNNGDTFIVCEYDPPGNFVGYSPFVKHDPSLYLNWE